MKAVQTLRKMAVDVDGKPAPAESVEVVRKFLVKSVPVTGFVSRAAKIINAEEMLNTALYLLARNDFGDAIPRKHIQLLNKTAVVIKHAQNSLELMNLVATSLATSPTRTRWAVEAVCGAAQKLLNRTADIVEHHVHDTPKILNTEMAVIRENARTAVMAAWAHDPDRLLEELDRFVKRYPLDIEGALANTPKSHVERAGASKDMA